MKYNFTVKRYKLNFDVPYQSSKICIVNNYTWTFKEFNNFVKLEQLSIYNAHCYFHPLHNTPYHSYEIGFTKKIDDRCYLVYNMTINKMVDGKLVDFNWKNFESKLSNTQFFKKYRAKRLNNKKEVISHTVVGI